MTAPVIGAATGTSLNLGAASGISGVLLVEGRSALTSTAAATQCLVAWNKDTSGDNVFIGFNTEGGAGTARGSIDFNRGGTAVRYNTTCDAELKTLIGDAPVEKSVDILRSTRLREFYWNHDETKKPQIAPFAQELYATYKGAISVGQGKPGDEDYTPWGVDKTAFSFHLVSGWQDHDAKINDLLAWKLKTEGK